MRKNHPRFAFLVGLAVCAWLPSSALGQETGGETLEVVESKMTFRSYETSLYVFAIGKLKNRSGLPAKDIILEAQFFDEKGALVDAITENLYSIEVPAEGEIAFRLQGNTAEDRSKYVSHKVRVVQAQEDRPCPTGSASSSSGEPKKDLWKKLVTAWFPFLLVVVLWILFMRKYSGKNSPQHQMVSLVEEQNKLLGRLVNVAEARDSDKKDTQ